MLWINVSFVNREIAEKWRNPWGKNIKVESQAVAKLHACRPRERKHRVSM
jgi:hypothetical protein